MSESNSISTTSVVVIKDDQVLLVKHLEGSSFVGFHGLPGGRLHSDETTHETLIRKVQSETGLTIKKESLETFPNNYFESDISTSEGLKKYNMLVFLCKNFNGELTQSPWEKPEWVKVTELSNLQLLPNTQAAITNALNYERIS